MSEARQSWLGAHAFLEPIARLQAAVEAAAAAAAVAGGPEVSVEDWARDGGADGAPLLHTDAGEHAFAAAADVLRELVARLDPAALPGALGAACRDVRAALERPEERTGAIRWVLRGAPADGAPAHAGVVRFLAWTAIRRALPAALRGAGAWCEPERWGRPVCPACGEAPAMAQLLPGSTGRQRLLACGCCGTRWPWRRIGCPFCASDASDHLRVLVADERVGLRIDGCGACGGYLKTYTGEGDEELFLADWPTLHLDLAAVQRGFRRMGASLYDLPDEERRS
jgi:FdhE protein